MNAVGFECLVEFSSAVVRCAVRFECSVECSSVVVMYAVGLWLNVLVLL